jgi:hypothetical protein
MTSSTSHRRFSVETAKFMSETEQKKVRDYRRLSEFSDDFVRRDVEERLLRANAELLESNRLLAEQALKYSLAANIGKEPGPSAPRITQAKEAPRKHPPPPQTRLLTLSPHQRMINQSRTSGYSKGNSRKMAQLNDTRPGWWQKDSYNALVKTLMRHLHRSQNSNL